MATLPNFPGDLTPEQFFLGHRKLIEEIASFCCKRSGFSREDTKDFVSHTELKLIEDNYAVIREFRGRSSPKTYLATVISNLHKDYRNHLWRKWRPSAEAERLGPLALRLEELLYREWHSFGEACQILWTNEKFEASEAELLEIYKRIPLRTPRHMEGEGPLESQPAREPRPDERVLAQEGWGIRRRLTKALQDALETLDSRDKLLVIMRTEYSVAEIARLWKVEQKPLYRQLTKIYKHLRKELERHGVRRQDVDDMLGSMEPDLPEDDESE